MKKSELQEIIAPENCENMEQIRKEIDAIDEEIVDLIASRAKYVSAAAKFKKNEKAVKDADRVKKVIDSKMKLAEEMGVSTVLIGKIYKVMIDHFVSQELKEWKEG